MELSKSKILKCRGWTDSFGAVLCKQSDHFDLTYTRCVLSVLCTCPFQDLAQGCCITAVFVLKTGATEPSPLVYAIRVLAIHIHSLVAAVAGGA